MNLRKILVILLILLSVPYGTVFGADTLAISASPKISEMDHYTVTQGLAVNCIGEGIIDQKGRMWLNPCREKARELRLSFFQFDGEQSHLYTMKPDWYPDKGLLPVWYILGETNDGYLYGADIQNRIIFYWHPDTRQEYFIQIGKDEKLLNMASDNSGGVFILTTQIASEDSLALETYHISRMVNGVIKRLGSIRLDFTDDIVPHFPDRSSYPFIVTDEAAWFFHQRKGLVMYDLDEESLNYLPWTSFSNIPEIQKTYFDLPLVYDVERAEPAVFEWRLINVNEEEILLFLGMQNGFFKLNSNTLSLRPTTIFNQKFIKGADAGELMLNQGEPEEDYGGYMSKVYFTRDEKNNLLIVSSYHEPWQTKTLQDSLEAILINNEGTWFDYSGILKEMYRHKEINFSRPGTFFSADFEYQLGSTVMEDGLHIVDLQPDLGIISHPKQRYFEFTGMTRIDSSTLLANSNRQVMRLSKWKSPSIAKWDRLTQWWHLACRTRSSIVTRDERVWMSVVYYLGPRTGLQWYDPSTNETDYIPSDVPFEKFIFLNDKEVMLFEDRWDLAELGKVYILDITTGETRTYSGENKTLSIGSKVNDLYMAPDGFLWVAAQNGLWQIDLSNHILRHVNNNLLQNTNINCISIGDHQRLWLGTVDAGIIQYDPETGKARRISEAEGLSDNTVEGLLRDNKMNIWASTHDGITVMNPEGEVMFELHEKDGLLGNWFYPQGYFRLPDGELVFAGAGGINILDPEYIISIIANRQPNKIYLTGLELFDAEKNQKLTLTGSYSKSDALLLPADHRSIHLDFAISSFAGLYEHAYSYRLIEENASESDAAAIPWIDLGSESQVTISNIPPGNFIIQVMGRDRTSRVGVIPLEIPITVEEFFYRKWWFYFLVSIPFVLAGVVWVRRNITEKKRLREEVERRTAQIQSDKATIENQAEQLQELDKAKSRFFTNISHEFRTPLTVILGLADQVRDQEKTGKLIRRNARLILNLVNQILELRKLESGNVRTNMIRGDVVAYLHYLMESFQSLADDKGISMTFTSSPDHVILDYDPEKMLFIVSNLLVNAIKFTPERGKIKLLFEANRETPSPYYQISVSDSGFGIPADKIAHIFDRFYQVDDEVSRTGSGTGIGLTLVKELVNLLMGEITVESKQDQGTTFVIRLPITNHAKLEEESFDTTYTQSYVAETESPEFEEIQNTAKSKLPRLLIVEDNADVVTYLISCLEKDYQFLVASDGQEGIDLALENVPDIIISDVMMPRVNGFELCNTLKKDIRTSHIPLLLLTAKADLDSRLAGLQRGADAYLAKPFDPRELEIQLKNLLNIRQQLRERYSGFEVLEPTEDEAIRQEDAFILKAQQIILDHIGDDKFGVTELCRETGMSRTQLHNKIKSLTGRPTTHLIRIVRIRKAKELLKTSPLNISQIAAEVGIYSLPYFSKIFSEETGVSPNKYRGSFLP